jgi:hypothetical protein
LVYRLKKYALFFQLKIKISKSNLTFFSTEKRLFLKKQYTFLQNSFCSRERINKGSGEADIEQAHTSINTTGKNCRMNWGLICTTMEQGIMTLRLVVG